LVDAAGVIVETSADRPAGTPSIAVDAADPDALPFRSVAAVLLALPQELRERVDVISATTRDDVSFTMVGAGHRVIWGSGERSEYKARVLDAAITATDQAVAWEYDVSAPDSLVVRRL
ncbi:MAG: cell division protein FtsQ/DivIB, partial [Microcella sp.]|nr:cell division protein FtsQ/DivIB [Microcella sp.]